jgi:tetratricopeptide (TPR) repeat protein
MAGSDTCGCICACVSACRYALVALRLRPNFGMAHYQAAVCYEHLGMLPQALAEAEKALEMAWCVM